MKLGTIGLKKLQSFGLQQTNPKLISSFRNTPQTALRGSQWDLSMPTETAQQHGTISTQSFRFMMLRTIGYQYVFTMDTKR